MINKVSALSEIVQSFLSNWKQNNKVKSGLVFYYWPKVIGEQLKTKTEAVRFSNGILWIKTLDPSLAYNLTFFKKEILNKYQRYLGRKLVRDVRVTVGELSLDHDSGKTGKNSKEPNFQSSLPPALAQEVEQIADPDLRKVFIRFYHRHQTSKKRVEEGSLNP
ncbi:MAG: DUF721 domain-containing protein [Firmicutes bacterium]|nr:DUF721 domain-containing protein [Bacillota bacterium]